MRSLIYGYGDTGKSFERYLDKKKYDYVHIFSGGVFKYHCWTLNNYDSLKHSKVIFDSSPLFPTPEQTSNYFLNSFPYINNKNVF